MDTGTTDKEFDDLLRKRYEDHFVEPEKDLWEGINSRLYQKKTDKNILKVRQLKIAVTSVAAVLAGVILYSIISTRENNADSRVISEAAGKQTSFGIKEGLPIKQSSVIKTVDVNSSGSDKTRKEKLLPGSDQKNHGPSDETLVSSARVINRVPAILIKNGMKAGSVIITEHAASLSLRLVASAGDKPAGDEATGVHIVTNIPATLNQAELILPEARGDNGQPLMPNQSGGDVKHASFFIEGKISPEVSYRALLVNSKYSLPDYGKTYFNKAEKPDLTFSAGISAGVVITDKLMLRSGAYYSRYAFKFKTRALNLMDTGSDGSLVYTSSGPVYIRLNSSDSLSDESLVRSSISFSFVNIPVEAEFHFGNNYFINLGLILNMLVSQNMNWQAENYDGNFYETTADPIDGLEFAGLSMTVGVGKEKYITRQLSVLLNPSVRINLTSLNNTVPVRSYPYSLGLNAGLRYYFD